VERRRANAAVPKERSVGSIPLKRDIALRMLGNLAPVAVHIVASLGVVW
jgi:hypothetical protein